jgi:hypothetical protein
VRINNWIFLQDGKPAFLHSPSQNGWLIDITAAQNVWSTVKEAGFKCLHTRNRNQDPLGNTFGDILVDKIVFKVLMFHHTNEINNKLNPQYSPLLYTIYNTLM